MKALVAVNHPVAGSSPARGAIKSKAYMKGKKTRASTGQRQGNKIRDWRTSTHEFDTSREIELDNTYTVCGITPGFITEQLGMSKTNLRRWRDEGIPEHRREEVLELLELIETKLQNLKRKVRTGYKKKLRSESRN